MRPIKMKNYKPAVLQVVSFPHEKAPFFPTLFWESEKYMFKNICLLIHSFKQFGNISREKLKIIKMIWSLKYLLSLPAFCMLQKQFITYVMSIKNQYKIFHGLVLPYYFFFSTQNNNEQQNICGVSKFDVVSSLKLDYKLNVWQDKAISVFRFCEQPLHL